MSTAQLNAKSLNAKKKTKRLKCEVSCAQGVFVRETFVQNILHSSEGEAAVEVEAADRFKAVVKVSKPLWRCRDCC
jgi:hypothetical protein